MFNQALEKIKARRQNPARPRQVSRKEFDEALEGKTFTTKTLEVSKRYPGEHRCAMQDCFMVEGKLFAVQESEVGQFLYFLYS